MYRKNYNCTTPASAVAGALQSCTFQLFWVMGKVLSGQLSSLQSCLIMNDVEFNIIHNKTCLQTGETNCTVFIVEFNIIHNKTCLQTGETNCTVFIVEFNIIHNKTCLQTGETNCTVFIVAAYLSGCQLLIAKKILPFKSRPFYIRVSSSTEANKKPQKLFPIIKQPDNVDSGLLIQLKRNI